MSAEKHSQIVPNRFININDTTLQKIDEYLKSKISMMHSIDESHRKKFGYILKPQVVSNFLPTYDRIKSLNETITFDIISRDNNESHNTNTSTLSAASSDYLCGKFYPYIESFDEYGKNNIDSRLFGFYLDFVVVGKTALKQLCRKLQEERERIENLYGTSVDYKDNRQNELFVNCYKNWNMFIHNYLSNDYDYKLLEFFNNNEDYLDIIHDKVMNIDLFSDSSAYKNIVSSNRISLYYSTVANKIIDEINNVGEVIVPKNLNDGFASNVVAWLINEYNNKNINHLNHFYNQPIFDSRYVDIVDFNNVINVLKKYKIFFTIKNIFSFDPYNDTENEIQFYIDRARDEAEYLPASYTEAKINQLMDKSLNDSFEKYKMSEFNAIDDSKLDEFYSSLYNEYKTDVIEGKGNKIVYESYQTIVNADDSNLSTVVEEDKITYPYSAFMYLIESVKCLTGIIDYNNEVIEACSKIDSSKENGCDIETIRDCHQELTEVFEKYADRELEINYTIKHYIHNCHKFSIYFLRDVDSSSKLYMVFEDEDELKQIMDYAKEYIDLFTKEGNLPTEDNINALKTQNYILRIFTPTINVLFRKNKDNNKFKIKYNDLTMNRVFESIK